MHKRTTIVIGAGASTEALLPTGNQLKNKIAALLYYQTQPSVRHKFGDNSVLDAIRMLVDSDHPNKANVMQHISAALRIRDGMPLAISIDHFMDANADNGALTQVGKLAIVRAILRAEKESLLYFRHPNMNERLDFAKVGDTWFNAFMQRLTENCKASELEERFKSVVLIIFNYDRCVEHFIYHWIQTYYRIDEETARTLVRGMEIYHPYGTVGSLPWYSDTSGVSFGGEVGPEELVSLAQGIRTFAEGTSPATSHISSIRKAISSSRQIVFLGFAYHRQNVELIRPLRGRHSEPESVSYFGTAYEVSESDCKSIRTDLSKIGGADPDNIILTNHTCTQFFAKFGRSLSFNVR